MGYVATVENSKDHLKYKISSISSKKKIYLSSSNKEWDMITNPGSVETRYESAVYRGTTLFRRHLVTMIEYAEVYVGKELSLSEFHDLVRNVITDVNIQGGASETLQNAFSRLQMRADIQTCRQLFMGFKKLDIIVVSKDLLGDWLDS